MLAFHPPPGWDACPCPEEENSQGYGNGRRWMQESIVADLHES
ncbi:hypothetical protein [Marispirochaeta sp.]